MKCPGVVAHIMRIMPGQPKPKKIAKVLRAPIRSHMTPAIKRIRMQPVTARLPPSTSSSAVRSRPSGAGRLMYEPIADGAKHEKKVAKKPQDAAQKVRM